MEIVDLHCYQVAVGRVYRHMAMDLEGGAPAVRCMAHGVKLHPLRAGDGCGSEGHRGDFRLPRQHSQAPGLGVKLDRQKLEQYRTE